MQKKFFTLFLVFLEILVFPVFSYDGAMAGAKNLKYCETKYFRIIYSEQSSVSASILYENADNIYEKLDKVYNYGFFYKMPVVITPQVESINAYWTSYPYNHIVLYDTFCSEGLDVFSETLLSVFTHELTHAYTFNMKDSFWRGIDCVFGDSVNLGALWITGGIAEGATVFTESLEGEGRLNDEFVKHFVKQAKIEQKFPKFFDTQGASDSYPYGIFYMYNGLFADYLCKKYGTEKYAAFWYRLVNGRTIGVQYAFKKEFGVKLKNAWNDFEKSIETEQVIQDKDFAKYDIQNATKKNDSGRQFSYLQKTEKGIFYLEKTNSTIYLWNETNEKSKKIFSKQNIQNFSASKDGRLLAINYFDTLASTIKSRVIIFDTESKKIINVAGSNIFNPCLIEKKNANKNEYILVASSYENMTYSTLFYNISLKYDTKYDIIFLTSLNYDKNIYVKDYADYGNEIMTFIITKNMTNSVCFLNIDDIIHLENTTINLTTYTFQNKNTRIRNISCDENGNLYFTYTQNGTMERLGIFNQYAKEFLLNQKDFSGGVFYPIAISDIIYVAKFYNHNKVLKRKAISFENESNVEKAELLSIAAKVQGKVQGSKSSEQINALEKYESIENSTISESKLNDELANLEANSKKYNSVPFYLKGIWFPLSTLTSTTYLTDSTVSYSLPFGITYISANPWTSSLLQLTASYGIETNSFGLQASLSGGEDTSVFSYAVSSATEFDKRGWKLSNVQATISSYLPFACHSSFLFSLQSSAQYGKRNEISQDNSLFPLFERAFSTDETLYLYNMDYFSVQYKFLYYESASPHSKAGFVLGSSIYYIYNDYSLCETSFFAKAYFPGFYPDAKNSQQFEYTFPFKFTINLFPISYSTIFEYSSSSYYPRALILDTIFSSLPILTYSFQGVLFSAQIQKAISFMPFFFANTFSLYLTSYGILHDPFFESKSFYITKLPYYFSDKNNFMQNYFAGLRAECVFSPNIGQTTNSGMTFAFYAESDLQIYSSDQSIPFTLSVGLSTSW